MSGEEQFKSPTDCTFKDFFAAKKAAERASRGHTTPSLAASSASPLLAVVAQVKRRAVPASRGHDNTPAGPALPRGSSPVASGQATGGGLSPTRKRPRVEPGACGGAAAADALAAVAATSPVHLSGRTVDVQSGAKAVKLLQPDAQQMVADKRRRKSKNDFLRQATSGLGAARIGRTSFGQSRPTSVQQFEAGEKAPETSSSDDANRAAQSTLDCPVINRPETKRPVVGAASRPTAAQAKATQPAGENHAFYLNARRSAPSGEFISRIHVEWADQYAKLEKHHSYIQWLFPVFENAGVNRKAHPLSKREAKAMRKDPIVARRIVTSYRMMLHFYGFTLVDEATGEVRRSEAWQPRFRNFNAHTHNNLRISRILVSLGELGFKRYKAPLLEALRIEIFEHNQLKACRKSFVDFWQGLVTDEGKPWYVRKTRETSDADRADSVFFSTSNRRANDHVSSTSSPLATAAQEQASTAAPASQRAAGQGRRSLLPASVVD